MEMFGGKETTYIFLCVTKLQYEQRTISSMSYQTKKISKTNRLFLFLVCLPYIFHFVKCGEVFCME
jgi:hypothetical protein